MLGFIQTSSHGIIIFIILIIHVAESYAQPSRAVYGTNSAVKKRQISYNNEKNLERSLEEKKLRSKRGEPRSCIFSRDCHENEWCHNDVCEEPCLKFDCTLVKDGGWCEVVNHQPVCFPEDPPNPKKPTEDCVDSKQCDEDNQFCDHNGKCSHVCPLTLCSDDKPPDGVCVIRNHLPQCVHIDELTPGEALHPNAKCRGSHQCEQNEWCYGHRCENPCHRLNCEEHLPPDGQCVVRDHLPVCKSPAQLQEEQTIRKTGGCVTSSDCTPLQWCKDGACEEACLNSNCNSERVDGYCEVIDHIPTCQLPTKQQTTPLADAGSDCKNDFDCQENFNCFEGKCSDPCLRQWCRKDGNPDLAPSPASWLELIGGTNYECIVWRHRADCVVTRSGDPYDFNESEA